MDHELIFKSIGKHIKLDEEEKSYFSSLLQYKKIRQKNFLLNEGEICLWSAFVTNGCLKGYTMDRNGFDHILSFAPPGWWIADMYSLISQKPGKMNIEAIEDTDVFLLSKKDQEELYIKVPKFERFFRIIIEKSLVAHQQRILDNMSLSAEERYLKFCETYPTLINQLPQKQIASYIGVTPEFFSRMRSALLRKK